jgi:hypothetical protein
VNLKMNSQASRVNLLELKEKLNAPMNTIMSISIIVTVPEQQITTALDVP